MSLETYESSTPGNPNAAVAREPEAEMGPADVASRSLFGEIYGSFWIDDSEFALPVSVVQEVVNEPSEVSEVPLSPPHMRGLFNLRGMIVPIVDLRTTLGFPAEAGKDVEERKVAIIKHGPLLIGLLFDSTGEILSDKSAARVDFRSNEDRDKDVIIAGVLKFENGTRMVQVLDPYEILEIEKVPISTAPINRKTQNKNIAKRLNCISFQVGHTTCALDLRFVQEVTDMPEVNKSFLSHDQVLGIANLRGTTLPVIDFRSYMGDKSPYKPDLTKLKGRKMLILITPHGPVGLMVYSIDSIIPYFDSDVREFSKLALPRDDVVTGCLVTEANDIVMLLDHEKLKNDEELMRVAHSCQEIFPDKNVTKREDISDMFGSRQTYIVFSVQRRFGLNVDRVSEVIERPDNLLEPPYSLSFVEGIVNLRGDLITLINPRLLYGLPKNEAGSQKVLIFVEDGQKYGILVDSVDEIIITHGDSIVDLPPIARRDMARNVSEDVAGCLRISTETPEMEPIMILDVSKLVNRCVGIPKTTEVPPVEPGQVLAN